LTLRVNVCVVVDIEIFKAYHLLLYMQQVV
jgi:hypothetical protein